MKKTLSFLLVLSLFPLKILSQNHNQYIDQLFVKKIADINAGTATFENIKHKMYLTSESQIAKIEGYQSKFHLIYNLHKDEMELNYQGQVYNLKKTIGRIVEFEELGHQYKVLSYEKRKGFFLLHNKGKNALLTKQRVVLEINKAPSDEFTQDLVADFKRKEDTLLLLVNNKVHKIPSRKKAFCKIFGNKFDEINFFIESENLSLKSKEHLIKIVNFSNTL
ncbi:hypothetical protein [Winogradskyella sp.]|uniref:hypothetical protein n=1 Tax=Winogradskyella sp. TaxID=1883156 RepID=UPI002609C899|nr:hypothetical protein [Winogradskyella sp.]